jgi:hypothetical protein
MLALFRRDGRLDRALSHRRLRNNASLSERLRGRGENHFAVCKWRLLIAAITRPPMIEHGESPGDPTGGSRMKLLRTPHVNYADRLGMPP